MRVEHVGLRIMVEHLGLRKVAKRFGVTERTVKDWLRNGLPKRRVQEVSKRVSYSERSTRGASRQRRYRELGWRRIKNFSAVDELIGSEPGHARERWRKRRAWWAKNRPDERLPRKVDIMVDAEGRLLYVNGDQVVWRGYLVNRFLFWTPATYLDGYDTDDEFRQAYETLTNATVRIFF
jgi:hypothetical protein